jgi:ribose-phosphate pyrophosphokinase
LVSPLLITLDGAEHLADAVAETAAASRTSLERRRFPDGESYICLPGGLEGRDVVVLAGLDRPDDRILAALFVLSTARELGARSIGLVAPYLPYMRQDERFRPGEVVSARLFCALIDERVDWVATVDPHLHRTPHLSDVFRCSALSVSAANPMAEWISARCDNPVIVGPDEESAQWVRQVAARCGDAPWAVMSKERSGDRQVEVSTVDEVDVRGRDVVLVDDIVSSGMTMVKAAEQLAEQGAGKIFALATHALFAPGAAEVLATSPISLIATGDTVVHNTNQFSVAAELGKAVRGLLEQRT